MEWQILAAIIVVCMFALLTSGVWISVTLGTIGILAMFLTSGTHQFSSLGRVLWNNSTAFELTAVPAFVLMAELLLRSGASDRVYHGLNLWLHRLPGGLAHTSVAASAVYAALTGASITAEAAVGTVAYPEMNKRGYKPVLSLGSIAAGGTLGILIPPSIPMIVYGLIVQQSVARLFIAGVLPGIMLAMLFMAYIALHSILRPGTAPQEVIAISLKNRVLGLLAGWPVYLLIIGCLIGLYFGIGTPTEVASAGVLGAALICLYFHRLNWAVLREATMRTVSTTCMVMFIFLGAQVLAAGLVESGIPKAISEWVLGSGMGKAGVLILTIVIYAVLGCFMDALSCMVLTLPIMYPIIQQVGFDMIWFGILTVLLLELGLLTPPVGMNLFVIQGISGRPLGEVIAGTFPYMLVVVAAVLIIIVFPDIALWLPDRMG